MTEAEEPGALPSELSSDQPALDPQAEHQSIDLLAAALRADASDLSTFERVLSSSLKDALPEEVVTLTRRRSMADRLAGREGDVVSVRIDLGDLVLELDGTRARVEPLASRVIRGVAISRKVVDFDAWSRLLAEGLAKLASESAKARDALARLLGAP